MGVPVWQYLGHPSLWLPMQLMIYQGLTHSGSLVVARLGGSSVVHLGVELTLPKPSCSSGGQSRPRRFTPGATEIWSSAEGSYPFHRRSQGFRGCGQGERIGGRITHERGINLLHEQTSKWVCRVPMIPSCRWIFRSSCLGDLKVILGQPVLSTT